MATAKKHTIFPEASSMYQHLSIKDLIEARDLFHIHLMKKENVVGTAIGKYRFRKGGNIRGSKRTLQNSEVRHDSWPCILVFVSEWIDIGDLKRKYEPNKYIPTKIYMPDGREVPICVIEAPKDDASNDLINEEEMIFPSNYVGGGFPLIIESQGVERIASIGCIVSDGNKYYALTNKHVVGTPGSVIYTKLKGSLFPIGKSSDKQLGNIPFNKVYEGWSPANQFINADIGLIEIDDLNIWKTDIFQLGPISKVVDVSTNNLTLNLIGCHVSAFGSVSGKLEGEISGLFYRYKAIGGYEYLSDFLIGPREGSVGVNTKHGDSGTVWVLHTENSKNEKVLAPIAVQWGAHTFIENNSTYKNTYALATCLSNVLRMLEVDIIRDWNLGQDYTWGKVGHYTIANLAIALLKNKKLKQLMTNNTTMITFDEADLGTLGNIDKKRKTLKGFTPLADVPDLVWKIRGEKFQRTKENPNHFADMDKKDSSGKTLLQKCSGSGEAMKFLTPADWLTYYTDKNVRDGSKGILPFRVWQIFNQMVEFAKDGDVTGFVAASGIISHYIGDSCQPLHISYMFNGKPVPGQQGNKLGAGVHGAYEDDMVNSHNKSDLLPKAKKELTKKMYSTLVEIKSGKAAAASTVDLMKETFKSINPEDIVNAYVKAGTDKAKIKADLWKKFGGDTIVLFAKGAYHLASLWQAAWVLGQGDKHIKDLDEIDPKAAQKLYQTASFLPSVNINDIDKYIK